MSKKVKALLVVGIVAVILFGAVSVYARNGAGRGDSRTDKSSTSETTEQCGRGGGCLTDENRPEFGEGKGGVIADYAELAGSDIDDVFEALRDGDLTIWELAEQEGNFEAFKTEVLARIDEHIAETTDADVLAKLTAHRDAIVAATTAKDIEESFDGEKGARGKQGGRFGQNR